MYEKVNASHPDKVADRIAGAIVDYAYTQEENPKVAVEVLTGHGMCTIVVESNLAYPTQVIKDIVHRITGNNRIMINFKRCYQDQHLAENQKDHIRCGDNGIFKGMPITQEQAYLAGFAKALYSKFPYDGKFIINNDKLIICQSNATDEELQYIKNENTTINPLGEWTGGLSVDTGATNRKLGSDMGDAVTGGGLHGKDLSKADVSVNIYCHLKAQELGKPYETCCAIGDEYVDGISYAEIVEIARNYIKNIGGFEKFAEWGLI